MKNKKILIIITMLMILIIFATIVIIKNTGIELQIIRYDYMDNSEKIIDTIKVKENDFIELGSYGGNDIKILEIDEEMVKISRDAVRYEIIEVISPAYTNARKYIENVIQEVKYDEKISMDINSREPFGDAYVAPRYQYQVRFVK